MREKWKWNISPGCWRKMDTQVVVWKVGRGEVKSRRGLKSEVTVSLPYVEGLSEKIRRI